MEFTEWIHYALRMTHLVAGVMWIGNSFYFMWLDSHLTVPEPKRPGVESDLWMVHSGGFYQVERRKIEVGQFPKILHWFKWEATFTWISGFCLLVWLYYFQVSIAASLGFLAGSWFIYDAFWRLKWAKNHMRAAQLISLGMIALLIEALLKVFIAKAAYIHLGAIFGTIMVTNVWVHILPSQQKMINATKEGRQPNYELSKVAKLRSTHNSYMTIPVLFTMLSNHFSMTYLGPHPAVTLFGLVILGSLIRRLMIKGFAEIQWLAPAILVTAVALVAVDWPKKITQAAGADVPFAEIKQIVSNRCLACHSLHPTDALFHAAPGGLVLEDPAFVQKSAARIYAQVVTTRAMPFANRTNMTDEERNKIAVWVNAGAHGE